MWYRLIKNSYDKGFWSKEMVGDGVRVGKITPEEYTQITGDIYEGPVKGEQGVE